MLLCISKVFVFRSSSCNRILRNVILFTCICVCFIRFCLFCTTFYLYNSYLCQLHISNCWINFSRWSEETLQWQDLMCIFLALHFVFNLFFSFILNKFLRMVGRNFGLCHSCRSKSYFFAEYTWKCRCPSCKHGLDKCFWWRRRLLIKVDYFFFAATIVIFGTRLSMKNQAINLLVVALSRLTLQQTKELMICHACSNPAFASMMK